MATMPIAIIIVSTTFAIAIDTSICRHFASAGIAGKLMRMGWTMDTATLIDVNV